MSHYLEYEVSGGKATPIYPIEEGKLDESDYYHWFSFFGSVELYCPHIPEGRVSVNDVEFINCELRLRAKNNSVDILTSIENMINDRRTKMITANTLKHKDALIESLIILQEIDLIKKTN